MISSVGLEQSIRSLSGAGDREYPSQMNIDPEKLEKSIETHNSQVTGFIDIVNKFTNFVFGYSKTEVKRITDNIYKMGDQLEDQYKIIDANLKGFEESAKTNVKIAAMMKDYNQKGEMDLIIQKMKDKQASSEEVNKFLTAYTHAGAAGEEEVYGGVAYKKSDYLKSGTAYLRDKDKTEEQKTSKAEEIIYMLLETKSISSKKAEGMTGTLEKEGVSGKFLNNLDALTKKIETNTEKDQILIHGDLPKNITQLREGGFKGAGVGAGDVSAMTESMGGMGGLISMVGPMLTPLLIAGGALGLVAGIPGAVKGGVGQAASLLDQSGEVILLLAIILPFIWDTFKKLLAGDGKKDREEDEYKNAKAKQKGMSVEQLESEQRGAKSISFWDKMGAGEGGAAAGVFGYQTEALANGIGRAADENLITRRAEDIERNKTFGKYVEDQEAFRVSRTPQMSIVPSAETPSSGGSTSIETITTGNPIDIYGPLANYLKAGSH